MACKLLHVCLAAIACMATLSAASPSRPSFSANGNGSLLKFGSLPPHSASRELQRRANKPSCLRIAPLRASISNGYLSTDGNGYRKYPRDELRLEGWPVNMVGSIKTGTMNDNDNEGHVGWRIDQVTDSALRNIVADQPNLALINLGTNNAAHNVHVSTISDDYIQVRSSLEGDSVTLYPIMPYPTISIWYTSTNSKPVFLPTPTIAPRPTLARDTRHHCYFINLACQ